MNKLAALFKLFRKGNEVANPEGWKNGQVTANTVAALLAAGVSAAKSFGVDLPVDDASVVAIAGGVFALANIVITVISSKRVGLERVPAALPTHGVPDPFPQLDQHTTDWVAVSERDFPRDTGGGS